MIYTNVGGIRDRLEQDLALEFCRKQNKYISILTESHIEHDQILHIRNNWLGPIFLSTRRSHTKGLIAQLHPSFEGVTEVDTDPKGDLCPPMLLSLTTEFSVFVHLEGITPESSWLEGVSLNNIKIIWKISVAEMKAKLYLETFILLCIKWTGMVQIKHKDFIDVAHIKCANNAKANHIGIFTDLISKRQVEIH